MKPTLESLPRRFYTVVDVVATQDGFAVRLDERAPRTPGGRPIILPTQALAMLVASEWEAQSDAIVWAAMPATRLTHIVLDAPASARREMIREVVGFAGDDLVCYFAESPAGLVARQELAWSPLIEWARVELGLEFRTSVGVTPQAQPRAALTGVEVLAEGQDDFALAALASAAKLFGSAVLALALMRGRLGGATAFAASTIDETFQAELWGVDAGAEERLRAMGAEAAFLAAWFEALRRP